VAWEDEFEFVPCTVGGLPVQADFLAAVHDVDAIVAPGDGLIHALGLFGWPVIASEANARSGFGDQNSIRSGCPAGRRLRKFSALRAARSSRIFAISAGEA